MKFKTRKHELAFKRNSAKGTVIAMLKKAERLSQSSSLHLTERESMKVVLLELKITLKHWRKFPPNQEGIEWKD